MEAPKPSTSRSSPASANSLPPSVTSLIRSSQVIAFHLPSPRLPARLSGAVMRSGCAYTSWGCPPPAAHGAAGEVSLAGCEPHGLVGLVSRLVEVQERVCAARVIRVSAHRDEATRLPVQLETVAARAIAAEACAVAHDHVLVDLKLARHGIDGCLEGLTVLLFGNAVSSACALGTSAIPTPAITGRRGRQQLSESSCDLGWSLPYSLLLLC